MERCKDDRSFGAYRLTKEGELYYRGKTLVQLSARLACILFELVDKQGCAISRIDLLECCWPEAEISEDNLTRAIADLRAIFRQTGEDPIETIYGLGYRLRTREQDDNPPDAIAFCKEAWQRVYQRRRATLDSAEDLFNRALAKDGDYVPALIGLAETQFHRIQLGYTTTLDSAPTAREALNRALQVDPLSADAMALKGLVLSWAEWDIDGAEEALKRALELDPHAYISNQANAWHELGFGTLDMAERHFRAASLVKPLSATSHAGIAFARMYRGDAQAALNIAREMVALDTHGAVSLGLASIFEAALGVPANAVSMAERSFALLPESPVAGAILSYALARQDCVSESRQLLESTTKAGLLIGTNTMAAPAWVELGEIEPAMAAMESGFATRCTWLPQLLRDPRLQALNVEPLRAAVNI